MKSIELLDQWIGSKIRSWSARFSGDAAPELLEIRRELLNDVRNRIKPMGQGHFVFPYRAIHVQLASEREGACCEGDELQRDLRSLLSEAGCPIPAGFRVDVTVVEDPVLAATPRPFRIHYSNAALAATGSAELIWKVARLVVVKGEAEPREYVIESDRTNLGRLKEVLTETGALRRRNDVAFAESEMSVSREHAYITCDRERSTYRIRDVRSQSGTSVFREKRELRVPRGSPLGLELVAGDEIHLGEARLRFELTQPSDQ